MIKFLIQRPVAVTMIVIAVVVVGIIGVRNIPVSLMPDIDIPQVTVQADVQGYSVQEMETNVVAPLRSQLSHVPGVKSISSDSRMDVGSIFLKFEPGANMNMLFIEINEKIDMAMGSMPKDVDRPKVIKASATDIPAFYLDVTFKEEKRGEDRSVRFAQLSDFVRNVVCRRLEQLPLTAMVDMSGVTSSEITCVPDENKLAALGLTVNDLQTAISDNNIQLSALSVADGIYRYKVHFDSQILTVDDVENININHNGRILQLKDLCYIEEHTATCKNILRHDGKNCITLAIIKQNSARMGDLKEAVDNVINDLQKNYPDIEFNITRDQTELLAYSIDNLEWNLLAAAFFTSLVLLAFMRRWRLAMLVALSIPLSLIITLLFFQAIGITLNIVSLSGLILGVGMIVDNSIIVIDNIMQKLRAGKPLNEAVVKGTNEVFTPMLSSVLTTCSVFLPLIFVGGMAGALFYDQSVGISISLFASLAVSLLVLPVYFYVLYKRVHKKNESTESDGYEVTKVNATLVRWHESIQKWMFAHRKLCMFLFLLCIPGLLLLYFASEKQQIPKISYTDAIMYVDWNAGISVEENDRRIEDALSESKAQIETSTSMCGSQDFLLFHTRDITSSEALVYFKCHNEDDFNDAKRCLQEYVGKKYPEASIEFAPSGNLFDMIFSSGEPDLRLMLQDRAGHRPQLAQAMQLTDSLRRHFPDVIIPSVVTEANIMLTADVDKMTMYGISFSQLCQRLRQIAGTDEVLRINHGADDVPVVVGNTNINRQQILSGSITNKYGVDIPLSLLIKESVVNNYKHFYGSEGGEYYPIEIKTNGKNVRDIIKYVADYENKHPEVHIVTGGDYFTSRQMIVGLVWVVVVALLLLFFILAAQFESMIQPLIILSEIAVDVFAVLLVLWLLGMSIDIMSMTGIIVMSGIVINDSILKIDTINRHRHAGLPLMEAIEKAGTERLMPIIMTSLTTIFSLLPFLSKGSIGADLQFPLSLTILVGMIVGTLVSIFFVPIVYYSIYKNRK